MATGGIVGTGLGQGSPTLIPYVGSDFIFAAFGEELGMIGAVALLLLYLILIARGLRIAMERTDTFGKLLATGLTTILALQTFAIVAGVTRLIPLTGVPLPLVSYGGSSRVATFIMLALLIRVSSGPMTRPSTAELPVTAANEGPGTARRRRRVDRRIRRLGIGLVVLFALLFAQLSYVQVIAADDIKAQPANARRQIIAEYRVERGPILSADGVVLAQSVRNEERRAELLFQRDLPRRRPVRRAHRLLLAHLRPRRARAGGEPVPLGRRARARRLDVHRPHPRPGAQGRGGRSRRSVATCRRPPPIALGDLARRRRRDRARDRRRARPVREPLVRPEHDLVGHRRGDQRRMGRDHLRPGPTR